MLITCKFESSVISQVVCNGGELLVGAIACVFKVVKIVKAAKVLQLDVVEVNIIDNVDAVIQLLVLVLVVMELQSDPLSFAVDDVKKDEIEL